MFEFIAGSISPAKGIEMLKFGIENILKREVNDFKVLFMAEKSEILFIIKDEPNPIPFTGTNKDIICFIVKNLAASKLGKDENLDMIQFTHNPDKTINLDIFMTKNGEKIKTNISNYSIQN